MKTEELRIPRTGLTQQDQIELGKRMSTMGDVQAREALILNCIPMVKSVVQRYLPDFNSNYHSLNYDDMFQDGMLGVIDAVDKYDYTKNTSFISYAYYFVTKRIILSIKKQSPFKVHQRDYEASKLIKSTVKSFYSTFQKNPTDEQISNLTSIPLKKVSYIRKHDYNTMVVYINDYIENSISNPRDDFPELIEKSLSNEFNKKILLKALMILDDNEKEIILKRYLSNPKCSFLDLASSQEVSTTTIVRREHNALNKLLKYFVSNHIVFSDLID